VRRRLLVVTLAVTSLLVAAFAIPLAVLVRDVARDRAITAAERDVAALVPVLSTSADPELLVAAIERTEAGADGRLGLWLPDGTRLGDQRPADDDDLRLAREAGAAFSRAHGGGVDVYTPVVVGPDETVVLRVHVPTPLLEAGVGTAWAILGALAVGLLVIAVLVSDRLARSITRPAVDLAATGRALAAGDHTARAAAEGPEEIAEAGRALNLLADRIDELLLAERERVADLSHRLRTPLTALRMDAERAGLGGLVQDVDRLETEVSAAIRAARVPLRSSVQVTCDLAAVTRGRSDFWGALADDDGRRWTCAVEPPGPHPIRLSEEEAAAAVDALLGNVFAHTLEATPYAVAVVRTGDRERLIVTDEGPGIADPSVLERGRSSAGSTGLGLDIATRAASAAGGQLRIERAPGGGARVILDLPAAVGS